MATMNRDDLWFWAYLHQNGKVQVKRWHGDHADYREDCYDNPFVERIKTPFRAQNMQEATIFAKAELEFNYDS